ncbi:hypothetical protein MYSEV_293 [Mythimna separata entomopoxvirus 'L']|uniref:Uncharacterized protein n=1 Tax=Mythimna separata entomopoxvirus 'L' TaxID=1293572 RepID=A0A916KQH2_9POXV|nr:hypothetical protein MYSEV_293 [Mythimna separata entomopoxvirus 'L']CCU56491.1 hypothetical protein MYSEV_293 [Mythimna separata entomopoxvirus 'L']
MKLLIVLFMVFYLVYADNSLSCSSITPAPGGSIVIQTGWCNTNCASICRREGGATCNGFCVTKQWIPNSIICECRRR